VQFRIDKGHERIECRPAPLLHATRSWVTSFGPSAVMTIRRRSASAIIRNRKPWLAAPSARDGTYGRTRARESGLIEIHRRL
jgi:hypothetical protein